MDNYNNLMDGNMDYQNIVYGGHIEPQQPLPIQQQQLHQNIMLQQNPEEVKNITYTTEETTLPRETIIANSVPEQIVSYQSMEGISQPRVVLDKHIMNETATYANQEIPQQVTDDVCQENGENKTNDEEKIDENDSTKNESTSVDEKSADAENLPDEGEKENTEEKKEPEINLIQCRICLSEENLTDIFQVDESIRISDKIMILAPNVKIMERDFLPHVICTVCIDKVRTAYELKTLIEVTDKDLKSKLRRSKKKSRRTREFVLIDAGFSDSNSDDDTKNPDDDEFHISEDIESEPGSSDSSYSSSKKRRVTKRATPRRRPARKSTGSSGSKRSQGKTPVDEVPDKRPRRDVVYIKAFEESDEEVKQPKNQCEVCQKSFRYPSDLRKHMNTHSKTVKSEEDIKKPVHQCNICNKIFSKRQLLRDHKKTHNAARDGAKIFPCHICKKEFSKQAALSTHIQRHRDDGLTCMKCRKMFTTKVDLKKHISSVHPDDVAGMVDCPKCKRSFTSKARLDRHKESSSCSSSTSDAVKKFRSDTDTTFNLGRDLFKAVAPVTTTYWSDSFSD